VRTNRSARPSGSPPRSPKRSPATRPRVCGSESRATRASSARRTPASTASARASGSARRAPEAHEPVGLYLGRRPIAALRAAPAGLGPARPLGRRAAREQEQGFAVARGARGQREDVACGPRAGRGRDRRRPRSTSTSRPAARRRAREPRPGPPRRAARPAPSRTRSAAAGPARERRAPNRRATAHAIGVASKRPRAAAGGRSPDAPRAEPATTKAVATSSGRLASPTRQGGGEAIRRHGLRPPPAVP
jgi:hypothetical protein